MVVVVVEVVGSLKLDKDFTTFIGLTRRPLLQTGSFEPSINRLMYSSSFPLLLDYDRKIISQAYEKYQPTLSILHQSLCFLSQTNPHFSEDGFSIYDLVGSKKEH